MDVEIKRVFEVRDDGYNVLAWSEQEDAARTAAEEIDGGGEGRAVRVVEVDYNPTRHSHTEAV